MLLLFAVLHVTRHFAVWVLVIFDVDDAGRQELVRERAHLAVVANHVHQIHNGALSPEKYKLLNS